MITTYSTRVRAPNTHAEDQCTNDLVALNPNGGANNDEHSCPKQSNKNYKKQQKKGGGGLITCRGESIIGTLKDRYTIWQKLAAHPTDHL